MPTTSFSAVKHSLQLPETLTYGNENTQTDLIFVEFEYKKTRMEECVWFVAFHFIPFYAKVFLIFRSEDFLDRFHRY